MLIGFSGSAWAQPSQRKKFESKKKNIEEEIAYTNRLLNETKKNKQLSVNQVVILNNKIQTREKLITDINGQVTDLYGQINTNQLTISELQQQLDQLKKEYATMIYQAYKNRNAYDRLMFIFAAKDFNQAYQRLRYFQQYSLYREEQFARIQKTQNQINNKVEELSEQKNEKLGLLKSKESEKEQLTREKQEKNETIAQLQQKEKDLRSRLKEKEKALKNLQAAIEKLVADEIRKAAEANKKKTGTSPTKPTNAMSMTPEEKELSSTFSANQGKLPWPVEKGIISNTFGEHDHPVLKGIKTKNNGINILTSGGANVRAVFNGVVTGIMSIPNLNEVVIIRHGEYLTVYSNLESVAVKKGDKVKTKQMIGKIYTDPDESKTELHFEIWAGKDLLDPGRWLAR